MKICSKCELSKDLNYFYKRKSSKDGHGCQCKLCIKKYNQDRYDLNSSIIIKKQKQYIECNSVDRKKYSLDYYYKNKEKLNNKHKQYIINNKEKRNDYWKKYQKDRWENDISYKTKKLLRKHIYSFLMNKKSKKAQNTQKLLGYNYDEFINKIGTPKINEHIDHKIPISWFKDYTPINIIWDLRNLQILKSQENWSKRNYFHHPITEEYKDIVKEYIKEEYINKI